MKSQKLIRAVVTREPEAKFEAEEACVVYCWAPELKPDGTENHPVNISDRPTQERQGDGVTWPNGGVIPVYLDAGEAIYAATPDEAYLCMSVIPLKALVVLGGR